jgi:Spy/CpxP family protein refolding chaperone
MKSKIFLIVFALLSLPLISQGYAQRQRMEMKEKMQERMEAKLNLTDAQKAKIDELRTNHQKKMIDLKANLEKKELELRSLRQSDKLNRNDFLKLTKEISEIKNSIAQERANHQMDVYELLDNNQKKIWREMKPGQMLKDGKRMKMHRHKELD